MTKGFAGTLVLACALLAAAPAARAQGKDTKGGARTGGRAQATREAGAVPNPVAEEMTKFTAPGPRHRELEAFAGAWTTRTRVRENPDSQPLEFPGSAEYRMILGGRFLQLESRLLVNGVENHGLGIYGYDAFKEKYSFYFIHDGETQALSGLGDRDSTGMAITFEVAMDMPLSGERAKPIRAVLRRLSAGRHAFEMFEKYVDGREWKVLEITYDRAH
jgi:hypothetical protein